MQIKLMPNIITFKNVFQYQMANFNIPKLQLSLHQTIPISTQMSNLLSKVTFLRSWFPNCAPKQLREFVAPVIFYF